MLCHVSIKQKRALKVANNNRSSGSQGMRRQEGSNNEPRLRKNENTNQNDFQMFSMKRARMEWERLLW